MPLLPKDAHVIWTDEMARREHDLLSTLESGNAFKNVALHDSKPFVKAMSYWFRAEKNPREEVEKTAKMVLE